MGWGAVAMVLLTVTLWGGNPVAVSYAVESFDPIAVAALRFLLAVPIMLVWCLLAGNPILPRRDQWLAVGIAGGLLFVQISLFNLAVWLSNSSHGSIFVNTFIFWVVGIEHLVTRSDRLDRTRTLGLFLAAVGVSVIFLATSEYSDVQQAQSPSRLGDLVMLGSALVLGIKVVYTKHALRRIPSGTLILWHDVVGVVLFVVTSAALEGWPQKPLLASAVWGLLYQGVLVAGLCFALQAVLLARHSATQISVFSFLTPLVGIFLGVLLRSEPISPWLLVAGACVAMGILLVNLVPRGTPPKPLDGG